VPHLLWVNSGAFSSHDVESSKPNGGEVHPVRTTSDDDLSAIVGGWSGQVSRGDRVFLLVLIAPLAMFAGLFAMHAVERRMDALAGPLLQVALPELPVTAHAVASAGATPSWPAADLESCDAHDGERPAAVSA